MPTRSNRPHRPHRLEPPQPAFEVTIAALGGLGDGIARLPDGRALWVADCAPGDVVRVVQTDPHGLGAHPKRLRGHIVELLEASPQRVAPPCPVFARCGGCAWQHVALPAQQREKLSFVQHAVGPQVVATASAQPIAAWRHRRRVRLHLRHHGGALAVGMMARASHEVVPIAACEVMTPALAALLPRLGDVARPWLKTGEVYAVEGVEGVILALHGLPLSFASLPLAPELLERLEVAGVHLALGRHVEAAGLREVTLPETLGPQPIRVDASGFCQATADGNAAIRHAVAAALAEIGPVPRIQEFFSGSGNLTALCLDHTPSLRSVERDPAAVARARASLGSAKSGQLQLFSGEAEDLCEPPQPGELWLLDPGRAGALALVKQAVAAGPRHVIYVSCAMDTLRRDVTVLQGAGFTVQSAVAIDAFPHTPHVEAVVRLVRN